MIKLLSFVKVKGKSYEEFYWKQISRFKGLDFRTICHSSFSIKALERIMVKNISETIFKGFHLVALVNKEGDFNWRT